MTLYMLQLDILLPFSSHVFLGLKAGDTAPIDFALRERDDNFLLFCEMPGELFVTWSD